ncbi:MAG: hypothetical protein CMB11_04780 [Euryarchaeota archaeon]|nr:hypothetical protein [Euryarchaeota archaeon]|tara:strand:- start:326 stop:1384 length:1059 start_codon:yes stop_codon:yes gene_type:complete
MDSEESEVLRSQTRALLKAVLDADPAALCDLVASAEPQLPCETAIDIFLQAFNADVRRGKVGARMCCGGLCSAVFMGISKQQHDEVVDVVDDSNEHELHDDNAITVVASAAVKHDDPRVLDLLIDWEPQFRMASYAAGDDGEPDRDQSADASFDSTAAFFDECNAPKCAARLRERRAELVDSTRLVFLRHQAEKRLVRVAKRWLEPCRSGRVNSPNENPQMSAERVEILKDVIADPQIEVCRMKDHVFTCGFFLLGRSELIVFFDVDDVDDADASEEAMDKLAKRALAEKSHADAGVRNISGVALACHPVLDDLLAPFACLRAEGVPAYVLITTRAGGVRPEVPNHLGAHHV